jgi:putative phosphoesterase
VHNLIGFVSDAHGNGPAFDKAVKILIAEGARSLYFLGDAVGYVPSVAVLDSLMRLGKRINCIRGNHEVMLTNLQIDLERESIYQFNSLRKNLTCEHLKMISTWPICRRVEINGLKLLLVHGSPRDPTYGYVYPDTDLSSFVTDADLVFMGNTHRPFIRRLGKTCYVNVGSCGLPRDDGRFGAVVLFDPKRNHVRILRFDIKAEFEQVLEEFPKVHPEVRKVYERRGLSIYGDIL